VGNVDLDLVDTYRRTLNPARIPVDGQHMVTRPASDHYTDSALDDHRHFQAGLRTSVRPDQMRSRHAGHLGASVPEGRPGPYQSSPPAANTTPLRHDHRVQQLASHGYSW